MKIALPISKDYVSQWTIFDALRELFQNAIDRESEGMVYSWDYDYSSELQQLKVRNKKTKLPIKSLLMGNSKKQNNNKMIGQFGEGYKLALIVLLRNNCNPIIKNADELWIPKIEWSEEFEADILTIEITQEHHALCDLIFEINIKPQLWKSYHRYNLYIQNKYQKKETEYGNILLDERHRKHLFVSGLLICKLQGDFEYGYDFKPGQIPLNRDRNHASYFDIAYQCGKMTGVLLEDENIDVIKMIRESKSDVMYSFSHAKGETLKQLSSLAGKDFYSINDKTSIPVSSEKERMEVLNKYAGVTTVIVKDNYKEAIEKSEEYKNVIKSLVERPPIKTPHEKIQEFVNDFPIIFENITDFTKAFTERIYNASKNWMSKI